MSKLVAPHGSDELNPLYVSDAAEREALQQEAEGLPSIVVSSATAANAVMLAGGYFNPLTGYMNKADALSVANNMHTTSGLFWPTPVLNLVEDAGSIKAGDRIALRDPNVSGNPVLAVMDVEAVEAFTDEEMATMTQQIYRPAEGEAHIGADTFNSQGKVCLSGSIKVLNFSYFQSEFPDTFRTAVEIRNEITERGWNKVVAFQTRNPMHLAHEELCHMAMDRLGCDGLVIHMLLGKLKKGDIPAPVRDAAIRKMVELDGRTPQQVQGMIDWSQSDEFWKTNILSAKKLREKYDQMKVTANANYKKKPKTERLPDWAETTPDSKETPVDPEEQRKLNERIAKLKTSGKESTG